MKEEWYRKLIDNMPVGVGIADMEGNLLYYNDAMLAPGGWDRADIEKIKNVSNLYFDINERNEILKSARENGGVTAVEVKFRQKNGGFYPALMSLTPITYGEKKAWLSIVQNISQLKSSEEKQSTLLNRLEETKQAMLNLLEDLSEQKSNLQRENAKDNALLESMGEGLVAVDTDRKVMLINKVAVDMLGWETKELIGKVITELPLEDEKGNLIPLERRPTTIALATNEITKIVCFFVRKDKTRFPIAITATPIKLGDKTIGLIEIIRDVTREIEVDRSKTEFISLASHQMRTPLSAVNWYIEMLLNGDAGELNEEQKKYLNQVYESSQRMVKLINSLLNVSRIELGSFMIERKPVDLAKVAQGVLAELQPQIAARKLKLKTAYGAVPIISADPEAIRIIFQNLLSNSVKYTPDEGEINLNIAVKDNNVLIEVANSGMPIAQKDQDKIFTKMFRGDNAKKIDPEGSGLGLYLIKSILDPAGGKIWFKSPTLPGDGEGHGVTFWVSLPLEGMAEKVGNKKLS